ncbi:MAG TPA: hypothetical protein PLM99_03685 [Candidatus Cloacimonadota bacterium]|nr:hypothetical protein [Candidatus Cloacimonadota bacterium]HOR03153.1 hypothetical protein [Candidatus Syntrophosphaera sp.]HPK82614.1 hypothetical protein [Candidatus Syntrophosphaera sp.]
MKRYSYLLAILLTALLVLSACSGNKKIQEPVEPPPTPLELAKAAADTAAICLEEENFALALDYFNQSKEFYLLAQPEATPVDSVDVNIERIQSNIAFTYQNLAHESDQLHQYDDAIMEFESAANIYKSLVPLTMTAAERDVMVAGLYRNMAVTAQKAGQYERALGYYDNVLQIEPGNEDVLMSKYSILKNDIGDPVRAYQVLKDYAEASNDVNAYLVLASAYRDEGDNNTAAIYYDKAMEIGQNTMVYSTVADFYRGIKNYKKSNEVLLKLIEATTDNASNALAYRIMADNYDKLNNTAKKIEYYDKSLNLEPNADVALALANHWNKQKNWAKVITYATKVINIDSSRAAAYLLRGNAYLMQKKNDAAKADLQRIQNDPNYGSSASAILKKIK